MIALACQGLRIAIPALLLLFVPSDVIQGALSSLPQWFTRMAIGGGFVCSSRVRKMVINLMANKEVAPFFFLGFALAASKRATLIATGIIGVAAAIIYLNVTNNKGNGGGDGGGSFFLEIR